MSIDSSRSFFQFHLSTLGYQIEQDNPVFEEVYQQYVKSNIYEVTHTESLPVLVWRNQEMKALLEPYRTVHPTS